MNYTRKATAEGGGRTVGWLARIMRHGVKYSKLFSDRQYGGWAEALAAAVAWYRAMEAKLPGPLQRGRRTEAATIRKWRQMGWVA